MVVTVDICQNIVLLYFPHTVFTQIEPNVGSVQTLLGKIMSLG